MGKSTIEDRWNKRVKQPDGSTAIVKSSVHGKVTRWRVRWVDESGRERTRVFDRKPDAQKFQAGIDYRVPPPETPFGEVAEQWLKTKSHRAPKTIAGYRSILDTIVLPRWEDTPIGNISYDEYTAWLGGLSVNGSQKNTPLSASRIIQAHQVVGAVMKYAEKTDRIVKNPVAWVSRAENLPRPAPAERRYLSHAELWGLAGAMGALRALTLVLGYCGLRFGEAAALRRKDVGDREITVRRSATWAKGSGIVEGPTKTHRARVVPVPDAVWTLLEPILPAAPNALVFPSRRGGFMPIEEYRRAFDKACAAVGIVGLVPHGLRHTTASLAISAGANPKAVQRLLGHQSAAMTLDRYGHLFDEDMRRVVAALDEAMAGLPAKFGMDTVSDSEAS